MEKELLPARMLNEFVYCPRLFFLEWVQGRFEDSDDTVVGRAAHRTVDQERGRPPSRAKSSSSVHAPCG